MAAVSISGNANLNFYFIFYLFKVSAQLSGPVLFDCSSHIYDDSFAMVTCNYWFPYYSPVIWFGWSHRSAVRKLLKLVWHLSCYADLWWWQCLFVMFVQATSWIEMATLIQQSQTLLDSVVTVVWNMWIVFLASKRGPTAWGGTHLSLNINKCTVTFTQWDRFYVEQQALSNHFK